MSEIALLKYALAAYFFVGSLIIFWSWAMKKALTRLARLVLMSFIIILTVATDAYIIEPYWIQTRKVVVQDPELKNILGDLKIVQISDIHITNGIGFREKQMIRKINKLKPDLIFFTGDIIDNREQIEPAKKIFKALKPKIGVYGIAGDTDLIFVNSDEFRSYMAPSGMDVLTNDSRKIRLPNGKILWLLGLDDFRPQKLEKMLLRVPPKVPTILLSHSPDILHEAARLGINLVLAGDTHGGQVAIDFLIRMSEYANRTPFMRGFFQQGNTTMYVNRGIGVKTRPIRFFCRPEISLIEFIA